jgi:hypothetical protein
MTFPDGAGTTGYGLGGAQAHIGLGSGLPSRDVAERSPAHRTQINIIQTKWIPAAASARDASSQNS